MIWIVFASLFVIALWAACALCRASAKADDDYERAWQEIMRDRDHLQEDHHAHTAVSS